MKTLEHIPPLSYTLSNGTHTLVSDVKQALGGTDSGLDPHELLKASLAACTAITVQMYANRKQWDLKRCHVEVLIVSETREETVILRSVDFEGSLDAAQRLKLLEIADKCPIHRLLSNPIRIEAVKT